MSEYSSISEFLKARMPRGQLRVIATAMGTSPALLSSLRTGKRKAGPVTCRRIAAYFKVPLEDVFRLAGMMDSVEYGNLSKRVLEQLQADADFCKMVEAYLDMESPAGRQQMAAVVSALAKPINSQLKRP